jgi:hypothetical protein
MWKGKNEEPDIDKFADFAKEYPQNARRVLAQLSVMSYTFADVKALQSKYGLEISNSEKVGLLGHASTICCSPIYQSSALNLGNI